MPSICRFQIEIKLTAQLLQFICLLLACLLASFGNSFTQCRYEPVCDIKIFDVSNEEHTIHHWNFLCCFFVASLKMIATDKPICGVCTYTVQAQFVHPFLCCVFFFFFFFSLVWLCERVWAIFEIGMCTFLWTAHGKWQQAAAAAAPTVVCALAMQPIPIQSSPIAAIFILCHLRDGHIIFFFMPAKSFRFFHHCCHC